MADRPIVFSAPMIQALLAGRKTQTRRVLKPHPPQGARYTGVHFAQDEPDSWFFNSPSGPFKVPVRWEEGDRLWVREAWKPVPASAYRCSEGVQQAANPADPDEAAVYRAGWDRSTGGTPWRPSIHMPRWASRITLTVTEVRVQRLQAISEEDAMAEGVEPHSVPLADMIHTQSARVGFADLWNTLHKPPHAWADDPWVAALTFTVAQRNIDSREVRGDG